MNVGDVATWLALLVAAWNTGLFAARWSEKATGFSRRSEWSAFTGASLLALGWAMLAGALLRGDHSVTFVANQLVLDVSPLYRLAAIAAGFQGAALTSALLMALATIIIAGANPRRSMAYVDARLLAALSAMITLLLVAVVLLPGAGQGVDVPSTSRAVPAGLLHPAAAARPALAVAALVLLALAAALVVAASPERRRARVYDDVVRRILVGSWLLSTLALGAEQWARTVVVSPATGATTPVRSAGTVGLWLVLGALVLSGGRAITSGRGQRDRSAAPMTWSRRAMLTGGACVLVAFAAHALARRSGQVLPPADAVETRDAFGRVWRLANQGVSRFDAGQKDIDALAVDVADPGGTHRLLSATVEQYVDHDGRPAGAPVGIRGVQYGLLQETLVALDSASSGDVAYTRVSFVPFAFLWIPGLLLLVGGCALGLGPMTAVSARDQRPSRGLKS